MRSAWTKIQINKQKQQKTPTKTQQNSTRSQTHKGKSWNNGKHFEELSSELSFVLYITTSV